MSNTNTISNTHTFIISKNDGQKHQKRQHHFKLHSSRKLTLLCHKNWQFFFYVLLLLFLLIGLAYADYLLYMHCFHPLQSSMTGPTDIDNVFSFSIKLLNFKLNFKWIFHFARIQFAGQSNQKKKKKKRKNIPKKIPKAIFKPFVRFWCEKMMFSLHFNWITFAQIHICWMEICWKWHKWTSRRLFHLFNTWYFPIFPMSNESLFGFSLNLF